MHKLGLPICRFPRFNLLTSFLAICIVRSGEMLIVKMSKTLSANKLSFHGRKGGVHLLENAR